MNISNIERIKEVKGIESNLRRGSKFKGEIKEINLEKGEVTVLLKNGKEIKAKVEGDISNFTKGNSYNFEVLNFEDGNLKVKFSTENYSEKKPFNPLELFLKENPKLVGKKEIIEFMMKNEISLTKENINKVDSYFQLKEKVENNEELVVHKALKYIEEKINRENMNFDKTIDKTIDKTMEKFKNENLKEIVNNTFKEFSSCSKENVMLFIENDLDFNLDNLKSFNRVFKEDRGLFNILKELNNQLDNIEENKLGKEGNFSVKEEIVLSNKELGKNINKEQGIKLIETKEVNVDEKINDLHKESLSLKREITKIEEKISIDKNNSNEEIFRNGQNTPNEEKVSILESKLNNIIEKSDNELFKGEKIEFLKSVFQELEKENNLEKGTLEKKIFQLEDKKISFSKEEVVILKELIENITSEKSEKVELFQNKNEIIKEIKNKEMEMENVIKKIIKEISLGGSKSEAIANIIKNNFNDFKLFNEFSNEYYYLDLPININKEDYGCKLIVKDERGAGKELDKNNLKLVVSVSTINLGEVEGFIKIVNKNLNLELKVEGKGREYLKENLSKLEKSLELLGFMPYIFVSEKVKEKSDISSYREFFSNNSNRTLDRFI